MTTTEKVCFYQGVPAPNMDAASGIHYGVIPQHEISSWALDDIITQGDDLGYEVAKKEFKRQCYDVAELLQDEDTVTEEDAIKITDHYFQDWDCSSLEIDLDFIRSCGTQELADDLWDHFEDQWNDAMANSCVEGGPYHYKDKDVTVELHGDGDLFVTQSKFWTECGECSPCAPNAGYLTDRREMLKAYCLPHDWFEGGKAPYPVYRVDNDEEVLPNDKDTSSTNQV